MRKYVLAVLIFLIPLGIGAYFVRQSRETGTEYRNSWIAARPIGPNHQSQPDDLKIPSGPLAALRLLLNDQRLQGNHLQGPARKLGDVLSDSDLAERPDLSSAAKGSQIYFYVVKEDAVPIGGWSENASVIPCFLVAAVKPATKQETKCIHVPLRIIAIHKSRATREASWLALEIPEKLRCIFAEFALADKRILYQVNATKQQ
jgi:hypothetical protein